MFEGPMNEEHTIYGLSASSTNYHLTLRILSGGWKIKILIPKK